ncbi:phosphatase PAP2 family protein [Actinoplanes sp. NPDC051513]|uniref:phosphatase PAP2 family protein n=1 Tax=Actinoplanes sp. NPDC051513 TaxID=3363908 RepID=UPI00378CCF6A
MNYQVFQAINTFAGRWAPIDWIMRIAAVWLIFAVFAVASVVVVRALARHQIRSVICLGISLLLAFGLGQGLARLSHEQRPFQDHAVHQLIPHAPGVSMPSDHATAAFALAFGMLLLLNRRAGLALTAAAVLIGFARVWAGVHYPGDILASAAIAGLSAFLVYVTDLGARDVQQRHASAGQPRKPSGSG